MPQFLHIPKLQLSILLFLIYLSALMLYPNKEAIHILLFSLGSCIAFDLLFTYLRKRQLFIPYAAIVTGLIITLIVDPDVSWLALITICAASMASKNFLRISGRHIWNPAGFGLLFGGLLFTLPVSWWGVSFQNLLFFLILVSPALISAYRMKRYVSIISFLLAYTLLSSSFSSFLDPTILFFSLVMLPEPATSPVNVKRQAMYGALVGLLVYFLPTHRFIAQFLPDVLIPPLLIGNVVFFKFK